jgi:myosin heavy subunit
MNRKIEALQEAAEQKKREAYKRVEKALQQMLKQNQKINFQTVAHVANVSTAYLYKYPEIKQRIQTLRDQQKNQPKQKKAPSASDDSKSVIIYNLREENKKLKGQIEQFRKANESLTGRLYQLQDSSNLAERLKAENARLVEENQRLQLELTSTREELEECKSELRNSNPKVVSIDSLRKADSQEEGSNPSPSTPEEEISNPEESIYDLIKPRLKEVGIRLSKKLNELINSLQKEEVLNALSAVEEYLATGKQVKSKAGLFRKALEENWTPNLTDEERQFNQVKESFGEWYKLAKNEGLVQASMGTKEGIMVLEPTGEWTPYEEIVKRGWTLEYLEERSKR